ncbi:MAG: carbohydrate ABC transporter permease [Christensenellaceae bacterium]|jgi:putative aldouronate transport system permease protein|nr:carbohydrate ABC transporter permease [Christensenellaceae bacterium]
MTTQAKAYTPSRKKFKNMNELSTTANLIVHVIFIAACLCCIVPLWIVVAASLTEEQTLVLEGYNLWPRKFSTMAYTFLFSSGGGGVLVAYKNTIIATLIGTCLCVMSVGLYAYPLSRTDFRYGRFFTFFSYFSMLFNAGTVAFYLLCSQILHINNSILALFLPQSFSAYWVIIMRTFYRSNVPDAVIESARIDGAGEWRTLLQIVCPLAVPGFATVALFAAVGVWNNFFNCLLLINDRKYFNLQYTIYEILRSVQALKEMASQQGGASSNAGISLANLPSESFRMAMAVVTMGPIVLAYPFFQRYFVKGLTIGAVKG